MSEAMKVGLVLSGGGAKGAYQVGVLKALQELGTRVDMVAGASIGSLNGAILAAAPDLKTGVIRLEEVWSELAKNSPLSLQIPYIQLLLAAGLRFPHVAAFAGLFKLLTFGAKKAGIELPPSIDQLTSEGLLSESPLKALMDKYLDIDRLAEGVPFYISVFESFGGIGDILRVVSAEIGLRDTPKSSFIHIQSLPPQQQKELLLASAAIPLLFGPREVNGTRYTDGGQGGWQTMQGNTPITPLLGAGCNLVLVTHLSDGSLWSRHDFPEATILEIRPQSNLARDSGLLGGAKDLLGFKAEKISSWIEQGYQDTLQCVGRVMSAQTSRNALHNSEQVLSTSQKQDIAADTALEDAMKRLH